MMASCSLNEEMGSTSEEMRAIGFDTYAAMTKAVSATTFVADDCFCVKAYLEDSEEGSQYHTTSESCIYMDNVEVKASESTEGNSLVWSYDDLKYWPDVETQSLSFFAYSVADKTLPSNIVFGEYDNGANITCDLSATTPSYDLLVAKSLSKTYNSGAVELTFSHAMCGLVFDAKIASGIESATTVTIKSLAVGFAAGEYLSKGTFSFSVTESASNGWISPSTDETAKTLTLIETSNTTALTTTAVQQGDPLYLLPQGGDATVTMEYEVATVDSNNDENNFTTTNTASFTIAADNMNDINTMYGYTITISLNGVSFDGTVTDWVSVGDANIVY